MAGAIGGAGWGTRLQGSGLLGVRRPVRPARETSGRTFPACAATARPGPAQDVPASCLLSPGSEPSSHTNRRAFKGSQPPNPSAGRPRPPRRGLGKGGGVGAGCGAPREKYREATSPRDRRERLFSAFPFWLLFRSVASGKKSPLRGSWAPSSGLAFPEFSLPADCLGPSSVRSGPSWLMGPKHFFNRFPFQATHLHFIGSDPGT